MPSPYAGLRPTITEVFDVATPPEQLAEYLDDYHQNLNRMERRIPSMARGDWSALCTQRAYWYLRVANITDDEDEELGHSYASVSWSYACLEYCDRCVRDALGKTPRLDSKTKADLKAAMDRNAIIRQFKEDRGRVTHGDFHRGPIKADLFMDSSANRIMFEMANLGVHATLMARRIFGLACREMIRDAVLDLTREMPPDERDSIIAFVRRKNK